MVAESPRPRVDLNVEGIPPELKQLQHWVAYRLTPPKKPDGKVGKVPVDARTGGNASSTDLKSWHAFDEALAAKDRYDLGGIGFMFGGSGYTGIDLDHCRDPETGDITPEAMRVVKMFATYTEVSLSGTGLHLICKGQIQGKGRKSGNVEIYSEGRFFTVSGVRLEGMPAEPIEAQAAIDELCAAMSRKGTGKSKEQKHAEAAQEVDDQHVIEKALRAKNGANFMALYRGDTSKHKSQSEADLSLCCHLAFWTRKDAAQMDRIFRGSGLMRSKWDEQHGEATYGAQTIALAIERVADVYDPQNRPAFRESKDEEDGLPIIVLNDALTPELFQSAQRILVELKPPQIFQREKVLVRIVRLPSFNEEGIKREENSLCISILEQVVAELILTERAHWVRITKGLPTRNDCPPKVAATLLAAHGKWILPALLGVIEAPTLRADGSYLGDEGYDSKTRLFADFGGTVFDPLPDAPTRDDALHALEFIRSFFTKFPFVQECDRSAFIAAILTALIRRQLPTSPLFAFRATAMGSGKTLLADVVSIIGTGRQCAVMTQGRDDAEDCKRMLSILIAGDLVVNIDNVERPLGGAHLCAVLTEPMYQDRLLGASKMVKVPTRTLFVATGNNLIIEGDLISRVVIADLDSGLERPEQREFEKNLRDEIRANRPALVRAALTILRAYRIAGRPKLDIKTFGRFEQWSREVRAPLVWLDMQDPLLSLERLRDQDPVVGRLRAVLHTWWNARREDPISVGELGRLIKIAGTEELCDALEEAVGMRGGSIDPQALGIYLRKHAGRIVDGYRLMRHDLLRGVARWRVEEAKRGTCGTSTTGYQEEENMNVEGSTSQNSTSSDGVGKMAQVPHDGAPAVEETPSAMPGGDSGFTFDPDEDPPLSTEPPLPLTSRSKPPDLWDATFGGFSPEDH